MTDETTTAAHGRRRPRRTKHKDSTRHREPIATETPSERPSPTAKAKPAAPSFRVRTVEGVDENGRWQLPTFVYR